MSREIKLRAWLKNQNKMIKVIQLNLTMKNVSDCFFNYYKFNEIELMQYTNLKDMDGTEIFEGDILPIWENGEKYLYKVVYDGDCFMLAMLDSKQGTYPLSIKHKQCEVIGNIYENKELLENE